MRFPRLSLSLAALCAATAPAAAGSLLLGGGGGYIDLCAGGATLSACQDEAWTQLCTQYAQTCSQIMTDAFNQNAQSISTTRTALAPDRTFQAGSLVSTKYVPYDYAGAASSVRGATGGYFGAVMNHQAWSLNPSSNGSVRYSFYGIRYVDPESLWQVDGTRSSSCEEYVYKRYLTASRYEDAIAGLGDDWMGILRKAAQTGFVWGTQEIDDETGARTMNWYWPDHAKNIYFEIDIDHLPLSTYAWDPGIKAMLAAVPGRTPSPDWMTLYNQATAQNTQFGEDKVELRYEEMKAFRKTLANRAGLWNDFQTFWQQNGCDTAVQPMRLACDWQHLITQGRLYNVDAELARELAIANSNGCLASSGPDACGIGPHQLVDEMLAAIDAQREPDYKECKRITANAFGSGSIIAAASAGQLGAPMTPAIPGGDYAATTASLKWLFGQIQQQFDSVKLPVDPTTHKYILGSSAGDSASFGSGWFGASYTYGAGWRIDFGQQNVVSSANVHVWGGLNAQGTVLGKNFTVVDFGNNVDSTGSCGTSSSLTANTHFTLLGTDLYSFSDTESATFNLNVGTQEKSGTLLAIPPVVIPLGPVPVDVNGGLSGGVGYSATLQGNLTRNCGNNMVDANIGGGFTPFAHIDAFAQAGIGVPSVLEAGIRGTVTLARVDVPFTAGLKTTYNGTMPSLTGWANLDLALTTFGGRIALFLDSWFYSTEMTLTSWPGKSFTQNLFHLDLGSVSMLGAAQKAGTIASGS